MSNQDYSISPADFWDARRGRLSLYRRASTVFPELKTGVEDNRRRMEAAQKKAVQMLRKSNVGKRRRHTVEEVVTFLESLPEQLIADVRIVGSGLNRNDYADDENLYSVVNIMGKRV